MYTQPWKEHHCTIEKLGGFYGWKITSFPDETLLSAPDTYYSTPIKFCPFCGKSLPEIAEGKEHPEFNPPETK